MENEKQDLKEIMEMVKEKKLLLPDFQRGFVWSVEEQRRLVASILAKMPIGSILVLEANSQDYGCRVIGRKDELDLGDENDDIYVLLDGQQRLTVMANVFSNILYWDYEKHEPITDYKRIISVDLKNRFFLKIPTVQKADRKFEEWFGLNKLKFPLKRPGRDVPKFLTDEIKEYIEYRSFDKDTEEPYIPYGRNQSQIIQYCMKEKDYYYVPLYLLINDEDGNNERRLGNIFRVIVQATVGYYLENKYDKLKTFDEQKEFVKEFLPEEDLPEVIKGENIDRDDFERVWKLAAEDCWAKPMQEYLTSCIERMDLHRINVEKSNRERAIDIYENLNLGGVTLSTFELVLAKAAKRKFPNGKNLYEQIVMCIQESKEYDNAVIPELMEKEYESFRKREKDYSAAEALGAFDDKKNQLSKKYTEAFLNVLSLVSHFSDYEVENLETSHIKREKILSLNADMICGNYKKVCIGIDRACFFLQARCGIRKLQELNYNLMLVLLGYVFTNDKYYKDKGCNNFLEAWYWISIFSGRYDKDQTENMIEDIKNVIHTMETEEQNWIGEWYRKIFSMPGFSDKDTLLLRTSITPKNVLRKTICQFYLAQNNKDIMTEEYLNPFSENAYSLEEHHIAPLGNIQNVNYKNMDKAKRNDKRSIYNSPLNFTYITKKSNREISNMPLDYYVKKCSKETIYGFHIEVTGEEISLKELEKFLEQRFDSTEVEVVKRIKPYLNKEEFQ